MCGLRTRPRTDVDPPHVELPSAGGISFRRPGAITCLLVDFYLQLFVVDLVDIGLMNSSEAKGRQRLNDTMRQLADAVNSGLLVAVKTASGSGLDHVTMTSLRRCDADVAGCGNASVVAAAESKSPRRPVVSRAAMTSSNGATVTSSTWRTVAELVCVHLQWSLCCFNRL